MEEKQLKLISRIYNRGIDEKGRVRIPKELINKNEKHWYAFYGKGKVALYLKMDTAIPPERIIKECLEKHSIPKSEKKALQRIISANFRYIYMNNRKNIKLFNKDDYQGNVNIYRTIDKLMIENI